MASDVLFPEGWAEINVDNYVTQHTLAFDLVDITFIPPHALIEKIRLGGMLQTLLENDPLKHDSKKRDRLNTAVLVEIRRQLGLLVQEYNRRIEDQLMVVESRAKIFLGRYSNDKSSQVVEMKPAIIGVRRG